MPSPYKEIPITFEKGLVTEIEESLLDVGQASLLTNWEPAANGALRVRNAWDTISKTGLPASYSVRGIGSIATGSLTAFTSAPDIVQTQKWPNGGGDNVTTKTLSMTGVVVGHVLVAVASDSSGLTPTITNGWSEVAIGTGPTQYVRMYTKVATGSSESFTYTISSAALRALTMYELRNCESTPGSKWAAASDLGAGPGSDSMTANTTSVLGGIALVGYMYDGGTPNTGNSGTAGMTSVVQDNENSRIGASYEDLDQLDGVKNQAAGTISYTTPSWTPPSSGAVLILFGGSYNGTAAFTVSGNGLTWTVGALSTYAIPTLYSCYAWADLSAGSTTGAITVSSIGTYTSLGCSFIHLIGTPPTGVVLQTSANGWNTSNADIYSAVQTQTQANSGQVGCVMEYYNSADHSTAIPLDTAGNWDSVTPIDVFRLDTGAGAGFGTFQTSFDTTFDSQPSWHATSGSLNYFLTLTLEIKGAANAAKAYHGLYPTLGSVTETFSYVANQRITGKMMLLDYVQPGVVTVPTDFYIVMALATGPTSYEVYRIPREDISSGTWTLLDSVTDATETNSWVSFAQGAGVLVWTTSSMNVPRSVTLAGPAVATIPDMASKAGRTAAYHKDRMFMAGSGLQPSRLYFSAIGNPTSFTTATDYLDIGGDDGEAIQDLISVEGLLLVAKTNRAYLVSGSGIESFFVNELSGGTAAQGRPVVRTPYGTVLAGTDDIWVVQGGGVDPMSRPLGSGYVITGKVSTSYANDCVLIADSGTGTVWRVNLVTGAWAYEIVDGSANVAERVYTLFSLNGRLYYGVNGSTREVGGTRRLSSARTYDKTTSGMGFTAATGRIALLGPSVKYTPKFLFVQLRNHEPTKPNELKIRVLTNAGEELHAITVNDSTQREVKNIGKYKGVEWIQLFFEADSSAIAGAIDIERTVLGVDVEAPR